MKELMAKLLEKLGELSLTAIDTIMEQAPILTQEILSYGLAKNIMSIVIGVISTVILVALVKLAIKLNRQDINWNDATTAITTFVAALYTIPFFFSTWGLISSTYNVFKILLAPRLYLLEYIANLMS